MKILVTILSFFWVLPIFSAEKITLDKYKELIRENYPNLYNYRHGRVFLTFGNVVSSYNPDGSDKVYVCKYTLFTKDTIIQASVLRDNNYYCLEEHWIKPSWEINTEEGKACEKGNFGYKEEEKKAVYLTDMILPPFIRPNISPIFGMDMDPPELHNFSLDKDGLVIDEWSGFSSDYKYKNVYDLSKPMPFIRKLQYQNDELKFETKELPEVNIEDLVLTLDKVPLYMGFLRPNGLTRTLKISDDFKKFWQEDIDKGPFGLPVTTVEGL